MIRVGLTGGIGSGKTTIAHFFKLLGVPVYFSDERAKLLMVSNSVIRSSLVELLGYDSYLSSGEINKAYISDKIFSNKSFLDSINKIVHPIVKADFEDFCNLNNKQKYIIKESAILIETALFKDLDNIILVTANQDSRVSRLKERDKQNEAQILAKISKQMSDSEKKKYADFVIENNNKAFLIPRIIQIHKKLSSIN